MSSKSLYFACAEKRNKYGNKKVVYDGLEFDSTIEGKRYLYLKSLVDNGTISNMRTHVTYELIPKQSVSVTETKQLKTKVKVVTKEKVIFRPVSFTPDFVYEYNGKIIAEDVKGSKFVVSKDFPLRQKLLFYIHGIYCNVVTKATTPIKADFI